MQNKYKIEIILGIVALAVTALPFRSVLAFSTAPTPPLDCTATITGYSNADPSSAVHCENVYNGDTWLFRGCIRLSTDGMHEIASVDYGTAGNTCDTPGATYHLVEMSTNSGECDGVNSLATCQGNGDYVNTVNWTVPGGGGGGGSMTSSSLVFVGNGIDTLSNIWQSYFDVLLHHLYGTILGILVLITVWYLIWRYSRSLT